MAWRRINVHRAAERGDKAILSRYLDAGGDVELHDQDFGATPVHWACLRGKLDAVSLLLSCGANLESRTVSEGTPLVWASMGGDPSVVEFLIDKGADVHAVTQGRGTALHHAASYGHPEAVSLLLASGADPSAVDKDGRRPGDKFDMEVTEGARRAVLASLGSTAHGHAHAHAHARARHTHRHSSPQALSPPKSHCSSQSGGGRRKRYSRGQSRSSNPFDQGSDRGGGEHSPASTSPSIMPSPSHPSMRSQSGEGGAGAGAGARGWGGYSAGWERESTADKAPYSAGQDSLPIDDDPELDSLRRKAEEGGATSELMGEGIEDLDGSVKKALADMDRHVEAIRRVKETREACLRALVEGLEKRLRVAKRHLHERDDQVAELKSRLEARNKQLQKKDREAASLRLRVKELTKAMESIPLQQHCGQQQTLEGEGVASPRGYNANEDQEEEEEACAQEGKRGVTMASVVSGDDHSPWRGMRDQTAIVGSGQVGGEGEGSQGGVRVGGYRDPGESLGLEKEWWDDRERRATTSTEGLERIRYLYNMIARR